MKKYLREIEVSGMLLLLIGVVLSLFMGVGYGAWPCGIGLLCLLIIFLYKAFHWKEYERENRQYIMIILLAIIILFIQMIIKR